MKPSKERLVKPAKDYDNRQNPRQNSIVGLPSFSSSNASSHKSSSWITDDIIETIPLKK